MVVKTMAFGALALWIASAPALAGPALDRIRAAGVLRCGGVERPGLMEIDE